MKTQKLNPSQVRAALLAGEHDVSIARAQGVSRQRISQLRHQWGIPSHRAPIDVKVVRPLVMKGLGDCEIGRRLGVTDNRVRHLRHIHGWPTAIRIREQQVRAASQHHVTQREIAERVGLSEATVGDIRRRLGLSDVQKVGQRSS